MRIAFGSWFTWLNLEPYWLRTFSALFRFTMYFGLSLSILTKEYKLDEDPVRASKSPGQLALLLFACAVLYAAQVSIVLLRKLLSYALAIFGVSAVVGGFALATALFLFCFLKAASAVVENLLFPLSVFPWRGIALTERRGIPSNPTSPSISRDQVSTTERLIWPQQLIVLTCSATRFVAVTHANLQAIAYLSFTGILTVLAQLPVALVATLGLLWGMLVLVLDISFAANSRTFGQLLCALAFILPGVLAWFLLEGRLRSRAPHASAEPKLADLLFQVKFGALHNWFVMNRAVARSIVERGI